ncbi:MAG: efflux RND transporter permease subunit, partial [Desulfonatronovibrionaceae bacterium]
MPDKSRNHLSRSESRGPIGWMAGNSVAANLLMVVLLVGGLLLGLNIKQEIFPEFTLDTVSVNVSYPGASPEEVEEGIILAVEEAVQGMDEIKEVESTAKEGSANIVIEMVEGGDLQQLAQDVKNEVDRITSFPEDAEEPQVSIVSRRREVLNIALHGTQDRRVLRETAESVRDILLQDPEVTQVDLEGTKPLEIKVEIPQDTLRTYGLTLEEVASRIDEASVDMPAGEIETNSGDILIRIKERKDLGRQFARIPIITTDSGTLVRLEDLGSIEDGFQDTDNEAAFNGDPAILINVYRVGEQTPVSVAEAVKGQLSDIRDSLPPDMDLSIVRDMSDTYRERMDLLLRNAYLGLGLVFILLALFLESRLAFWVSLGIPISFLGSMFFLPWFGVSLNMISLFAFIITLGIVVDDAIVVGENVYSYHQKGVPLLRAAVLGAKDIAMPVIFSVTTNIVAFLPMFFIPGVMGKIFKTIPAVVASVFLISLIECLFILPAHLGHQMRKKELTGPRRWLHNMQQSFSHKFMHFVHNKYRPFLEQSIKWRYLTLALAAAVLILAAGFIKSGRLGMTMFPKIESRFSYAQATLPYGTARHKVEEVNKRLVRAAAEIGEENGGDNLLKGIYTRIDNNEISIRAFLTSPEIRPLSTDEFTRKWRDRVGDIPGLESLVYESDRGGPGAGKALDIALSHRDLETLRRAGEDLAAQMELYPNVKDVYDGFSPGKRQYDITLRPEARSMGFKAADIARKMRSRYYGAEALRQQRGRNELKVMVRLPEEERKHEYFLEEMVVRNPEGKELKLSEAVDMRPDRAYTEINRKNGRRVINVTADVLPRSQASQVLSDLQAEALPELMNNHPGLDFGLEGRQADIKESMDSLYQGLFLALLGIFALLAVPFRSYLQPLIIMVGIPFGIVGAVLGHIVMG